MLLEKDPTAPKELVYQFMDTLSATLKEIGIENDDLSDIMASLTRIELKLEHLREERNFLVRRDDRQYATIMEQACVRKFELENNKKRAAEKQQKNK